MKVREDERNDNLAKSFVPVRRDKKIVAGNMGCQIFLGPNIPK
jgi:hypothetical protein